MKGLKFYLVVFLLSLPVIAQAHGYWFEITGSGKVGDSVHIKICFGEIDDYSVRHREAGPELALTGSFKLFVVDNKGKRTNLVISPRKDCWEASFVPSVKGTYQILGINEDLPVVDRSASGGESVRPIEYLCAAYHVESSAPVQQPYQFMDILVSSREKLTVVKAYRNKVAVNTKLRVFNPENWEKSLSIEDKQEAVFFAGTKGLYIIRQDWADKTPGNWQGKPYTSIRYRCNYCLQVQ